MNAKMTPKEYSAYIDKKSPNSHMGTNALRAFLMGGAICTIGQAFLNLYQHLGAEKEAAGTFASITLIFLGALLTGLGLYDKLTAIGMVGAVIPITGFSNSVVAPAMEFKSEGYVTGTSAKLFTIAGPVLVFGVSAATLYGIIFFIATQLIK